MSFPFDRKPGPYGSALDLPSIAEMLEQIQAAKLLTRVLARGQRSRVVHTERQVREVADVMDQFCSLLGPRNWVCHDSLNLESTKRLIGLPAEEAERALIAIYQDAETLGFLIMSLHRFPEMRARMHLIDLAKEDYQEGRYYSAVQMLLTVMDGFVNDVEREQRRGLHARSPDDMNAWDSIVGHHLGLSHALKTVNKTFRKTVTEEVFELYRHGILHGMVLNFNNDVVATKGWNILFAVADWATSRQKQKMPPKPRPGWREAFKTMAANAQAKAALARWQPSSLSHEEPTFDTDEVVGLAREYLTAWLAKNYGRMAGYLWPRVAESAVNKTAGMIKEEFRDNELSAFTVQRVEYEAAAVAGVQVLLTVNGKVLNGRMGWIRVDDTGDVVAPNHDGFWRLTTWGLLALTTAHRPKAS